MIVPLILLLLSAAGLAVSLAVPGLTDWLLLAGPCALASLILLIQALARRPAPAKRRWVLVDGSNVMHWKGGIPDLATVREVTVRLGGLGYTPRVIFDANVGHKVAGRYLNGRALAGPLGLAGAQVWVVPAGTPADPAILSDARDLGAQVVSNDRFRDWAEAYPEIAGPGFLVRGGYRQGRLRLDLDARAPGERRRPAPRRQPARPSR
ncbi:hypothetical protein OG2516_17855 [Oceanicola granulosus HTCC2516]|uniref:RNase NYN domain-containing protein n=1 Tax=Oceanicola granulosus (strain ATCC BAA-861 / DSM 15982 / KCTC 12143 / HTCC2516) TaxID=314256 RepID=Q2CF09_OCEGH|nr:hypothetical protein [Oceanicola granulosus]EAR51318.1 hypothetical protein OG2516_17855 [Oceanicola granulosus HTCC2516]